MERRDTKPHFFKVLLNSILLLPASVSSNYSRLPLCRVRGVSGAECVQIPCLGNTSFNKHALSPCTKLTLEIHYHASNATASKPVPTDCQLQPSRLETPRNPRLCKIDLYQEAVQFETDATIAVIKQLRGMKHLKNLTLSDTRLSSASIYPLLVQYKSNRIFQNLPKLTTLDITKTKITALNFKLPWGRSRAGKKFQVIGCRLKPSHKLKKYEKQITETCDAGVTYSDCASHGQWLSSEDDTHRLEMDVFQIRTSTLYNHSSPIDLKKLPSIVNKQTTRVPQIIRSLQQAGFCDTRPNSISEHYTLKSLPYKSKEQKQRIRENDYTDFRISLCITTMYSDENASYKTHLEARLDALSTNMAAYSIDIQFNLFDGANRQKSKILTMVIVKPRSQFFIFMLCLYIGSVVLAIVLILVRWYRSPCLTHNTMVKRVPSRSSQGSTRSRTRAAPAQKLTEISNTSIVLNDLQALLGRVSKPEKPSSRPRSSTGPNGYLTSSFTQPPKPVSRPSQLMFSKTPKNKALTTIVSDAAGEIYELVNFELGAAVFVENPRSLTVASEDEVCDELSALYSGRSSSSASCQDLEPIKNILPQQSPGSMVDLSGRHRKASTASLPGTPI